jgi:hypothetical protein
MPSPALPSDTPSASETPVGANPDEALLGFWERYREAIVAGCIVVLLGIVGWNGVKYFSEQKEAGIERDYAEATTPDKLRAFVDAHPDHALAGVAELRVADAAYQAGQNADALAAYDRAASMLKGGILAARAQLGGAIIKIQAGQAADGVATLHQLADDPKQFTQIRAEAYFHLASLAAEAGRAAEVQQISTQLMQVEPSSPWTQRAFGLQAQVPVTAGPAAPAAATPAPAGTIAFPSGK